MLLYKYMMYGKPENKTNILTIYPRPVNSEFRSVTLYFQRITNAGLRIGI